MRLNTNYCHIRAWFRLKSPRKFQCLCDGSFSNYRFNHSSRVTRKHMKGETGQDESGWQKECVMRICKGQCRKFPAKKWRRVFFGQGTLSWLLLPLEVNSSPRQHICIIKLWRAWCIVWMHLQEFLFFMLKTKAKLKHIFWRGSNSFIF